MEERGPSAWVAVPVALSRAPAEALRALLASEGSGGWERFGDAEEGKQRAVWARRMVGGDMDEIALEWEVERPADADLVARAHVARGRSGVAAVALAVGVALLAAETWSRSGAGAVALAGVGLAATWWVYSAPGRRAARRANALVRAMTQALQSSQVGVPREPMVEFELS